MEKENNASSVLPYLSYFFLANKEKKKWALVLSNCTRYRQIDICMSTTAYSWNDGVYSITCLTSPFCIANIADLYISVPRTDFRKRKSKETGKWLVLN